MLPLPATSRSQLSSLIILLTAIGFASGLSACGVAYTVIKSESKLDKLSVPMTKAQVVDEIGRQVAGRKIELIEPKVIAS